MAQKLGKRWQHVPNDQPTMDRLIWAFEVRNRTLNRSPKTTSWELASLCCANDFG